MPTNAFGISIRPNHFDDLELMQRIVLAYRKAIATPLGSANSIWLTGSLFELRKEVHDQLMSENPVVVQELLRDPGKSDLFYGFEDNARSLHVPIDHVRAESLASGGYEHLLLLSEAIGAIRLRHPLAPQPSPELSEILVALDAAFGIRVEFPNPFPGDVGIDTDRGISTYKAPAALYQAWRIKHLVEGISAPRVLEIGAGLGRTAYYAWQLGIRDYTIVDLPLTCVAQANFLGRTLGERHVQLYGESKTEGVRIIPPEEFLRVGDNYDIAINVDSLTEMARETAQTYFDQIDSRANIFLSINHEVNLFRARDLFAHRHHSRAPYLLRGGYVEEVVETDRLASGKSGLKPRRALLC
jgi:hypothetical protein